MTEFKSRYKAKKTDAKGYVSYTAEEDAVWEHLYARQIGQMPLYACEEHIKGLALLDLSNRQVPQLPDVSAKLQKATSWQVFPVEALISAEAFFQLLAARRFPAATFIRTTEEIDYVKEPDIFHELFGHCPLLTEPVFAEFVQQYAQKVLQIDQKDWPLLQRLFWFTVEFGLIKTADSSIRAYGGGILSSFTETKYCIEDPKPQRKSFDPLEILRTPYRIDQLQSTYFVINSYQELFDGVGDLNNLKALLAQAHKLGEYPPRFAIEPDNPSIHIHAC
jgi:phenylalanine-4-hydroxylase